MWHHLKSDSRAVVSRDTKLRRLRVATALLVVLLTGATAEAEVSEARIAAVRASVPEVARALCEATLDDPQAAPLQFAFAALWLNERVAEANDRLRGWFAQTHGGEQPLDELLDDPSSHAAELGQALGRLKWTARLWLRIYYLFWSGADAFPGRLEADTERRFQELCWAFAAHHSALQRADLKYLWAIQGSENHDMMDLANALLALQAVKDLPDYRDRALADGHTAQTHFDAWVGYYREYCRSRASHGLFVEVASPIYGKYMLGELVNIHDFVADGRLRRKMGMLLDVTWADWAIDQLDGVRGGGKSRTYFGHYAERGTSDSWYMMSSLLLDRPQRVGYSWAARHGGVEYVLPTSSYRLPDVVLAIALDEAGRGEYEYISRRPARMLAAHQVAERPPLQSGTWYHLDAAEPQLVRYSYCTPDYVLGSFRLDPALRTSFRLEADNEPGDVPTYAAISSQSRWQGVIFASGPNARVFPQCVGEHNQGRVNYDQHVAVQHKNVLLVRKRVGARYAGAMRVFFADGMKDRLEQEGNWLFLREGDAYLAVGVLSPDRDNRLAGYRWHGANWVYPDDEYAPVVFVLGRHAEFADLAAFRGHVEQHRVTFTGRRVEYAYPDTDGELTTLSLYLKPARKLPEINGAPIELAPRKVYDSPFLEAEFGSPVITIRKGRRELTHDFSATGP